ncbi:MAG TPA: DUF58 domain-containing protein [Frankiaceae bacterium]|nr:DUF58 domain-containing protein [Frankiaceae bacterium]
MAAAPADGCDTGVSRFPGRLTDLGARVFTLGLVLALLATLTGSRVLLAAGTFVGLLPWVSMLTLVGRRLEITAEGTNRGRVGSVSPLRVRIRNSGPGSLPAVEVRCVRPLFLVEVGGVGPLPPRAAVCWELDAAPVARGISTHLHVETTGTDLFGLSLRRATVLIPLRLAVGPRAVPVPRPVDPLPRGTALDPGDLRAWRPGDSPSAVAWRASARRSTGPASSLVVRERVSSEPDVVRLGAAGGSPETTERVLEILTAVALAHLERGRQLEVRIGEQRLRPAGPDVLLDVLAALLALPALPAGSYDLVITGRNGGTPAGGTRWIVDASGGVEVA